MARDQWPEELAGISLINIKVISVMWNGLKG